MYQSHIKTSSNGGEEENWNRDGQMVDDLGMFPTIREMNDSAVEPSTLEFNNPSEFKTKIRVGYDGHKLAIASIFQEMNVTLQTYPEYAVLSNQVDSQEELWKHLDESDNQIVSLGYTAKNWYVTIETADDGDDITAVITTNITEAQALPHEVVEIVGGKMQRRFDERITKTHLIDEFL